jgi:uroporphyrin-III C-methyltransferase
VKPIGLVTLVGAGPGDPDLLTVKAVKAIAAADVIVFDRLVSAEVLALAPSNATCIDVGKQSKRHPVPQDEINRLLVQLARGGHNVVRLKGGDPLIFGRGSEETLELRRCGVPFRVVPGITAAQGCAASLAVPLTHRGIAHGVHYVTGHCREDHALDLDWQGLADAQTTLVIYMGLANIGEIASQLVAAGRSRATPVLAVCNATKPSERRLTSTLAGIATAAKQADFEGAVLFVVGEVVSLTGARDEEGAHDHETPLATAAV